MKVRKRNGSYQDVIPEKIFNSVQRVCENLDGVDFWKVSTKTVGGLYDGVTTEELDRLSIRTAVGLIKEEPIYSKVAAKLLANFIRKEVELQEIYSFSQSIQVGHDHGLIADETYEFIMKNKRKLNTAIDVEKDNLFEFYGMDVVYSRYLAKHPETRKVIETPQYWLMRVAAGLSENVNECIEFYKLISSLEYLTSTPTLFNSGTKHSQMSSCYLLDSPDDDLANIYKNYSDIALLSKFAGGIGVSYSRVRGAGSHIKGTNGKSNGVIPFLHTLDSSVAAVNQGGKRKGAACVYLETWHPDIMDFLALRDPGGEKERRAHNINLANWIPDLFMKRLQKQAELKKQGSSETVMWSLIDPKVAPDLVDIYGEEFEKRYEELEEQGLYKTQVPVNQLWERMLRTLAQSGNGWMCWKDASNSRCNSAVDGNVVHLSNLCTEILEPNYHDKEISVCNLGSLNLSKYVKNNEVDIQKIRKNVKLAVKFLDKVIDKNFYPVPESKASNDKWRPIGLGIMGLHEMLMKLRIPFESDEAVAISAQIQEEIYYTALKTSCELAKQNGPHKGFEHTYAAKGLLQFDLAGHPKDEKRWNELKEQIKEHGLRNSLLIAIAPTATIAGICGTTECIEPLRENLFKRETLSGEYVEINRQLVQDLKELNLWNDATRAQIIKDGGSVQNLPISDDMKKLYKTVWEMSMKWLINHAAARGLYIDQSQSLNLFQQKPDLGKMSSMYMYAWTKGIKTTYYLRSLQKTFINHVTTGDNTPKVEAQKEEEICESCT